MYVVLRTYLAEESVKTTTKKNMYLLWNCVFHLKRNFHEVSLCGSFYLKKKLSYQPTSHKCVCEFIFFI